MAGILSGLKLFVPNMGNLTYPIADISGIQLCAEMIWRLKLMPTGGVNLTNAGEWLKSGACAVGVGSALVDNTAIKNEEYAQLTANAKILMNSINSFREKIIRDKVE